MYVPPALRCFKCQSFGHVSAKCRSTYHVCAKCGGKHKYEECNESSLKCKNCGGAHSAAYKGCIKYQEAVQIQKVQVEGISIDVNKMWSFNPVAFVLFVVELYHILGHAAILFRVRLLPRKDLVRIRYYFLFDAASVFITCFLYTGRLKWLASLQILQHLYYFVTWNKSALANKIMDWSSLDYFKSHKKDRLELDSILGTAFDISVHVLNVYMLMSYLTTVGILLGLAVAHGSAYFILYNPRLAWSSPYKMPAWIERRIRPLQP